MKVTITDIAKKLGVHVSTVSLALNDSPKISKATKKRVRDTAVEMGYQTNPYVAALMSSIRSGKLPKNPPTMAFITSSQTPDLWKENHQFNEFHDSCQSVARNLGMRIEPFWIGDPNLSAKRLDDILYNRGILGGIFLPTGNLREKMNHSWNRIAGVSYGIYDIAPNIDRVKADHYGNMETVLKNVVQRNFKRIGFAMETPYPYANHNQWLAAYLMEQRDMPPELQLEPMLDPTPSFETFKSWFNQTKPDIVICVHASKTEKWLNELGLEVPRDVSLITVADTRETMRYSGMIENASTCGKLAIETLLDRIHQNQIGPPASPRRITVRGRWYDGETIR